MNYGEINMDLIKINIPDLFKNKFDSDLSIKDILEIYQISNPSLTKNGKTKN